LENQLSAITRELRGLTLEKEHLTAGGQLGQLEEEGRKLMEELGTIER
jgi:hypothetical protein